MTLLSEPTVYSLYCGPAPLTSKILVFSVMSGPSFDSKPGHICSGYPFNSHINP